MSYIGRSAKLSRKTQEKVSFLATAGQTVATGLAYVPTFVEVILNGSTLTDVTDYTATDGNSITFLGDPLTLNDEVTIISLKTFALADHYNKSEADALLAAKGLAQTFTETQSFNRVGSDGVIVDFEKDGATVGSIGTGSNELIIGTGNTALRFWDYGNALLPRTTANGVSNGVITLGEGSNRFKDAYLSGRVHSAGGADAAIVSTTAPSSPSVGDFWFDSTSGISAMKTWSGAAWDQLSNKFSATGGAVTTYSSGGTLYKVHTYTSSGTFSVESSGFVDVLMVGGGGGGGCWVAGGGGAGGMVIRPSLPVTAQSFTITIGGGGTGVYNPGSYGGMPNGSTGSNSTGFGMTAVGGGLGSCWNQSHSANGGSGGGGSQDATAVNGIGQQPSQSGDSGTYGFGNNGGGTAGSGSGHNETGGGGAGGAAPANTNGGVGKVNNYRTGSNIYYAGGGAAGVHDPGYAIGQGGTGGGGNGTNNSSVTGGHGTSNLGGGAGGGGNGGSSASRGGNGGSGVVIVRYQV